MLLRVKEATLKRRLEDWRGFEGEEQLLGVLAEGSALIGGHDELADEAGTVTDVIVLVVFSQVQHVLSQQLGLSEEEEKNNRM